VDDVLGVVAPNIDTPSTATWKTRGTRLSPPNTMNKQLITQYYRKHQKAIVGARSTLLYGGGWSLGYFTSFGMASAAIPVLATIVGGYDISKTADHEVTNRTLGSKTLVTLAAIGAIVICEYWEAPAVVFLFSLGSYLEGRTMRKTPTALQEPLEMTPDTATVHRDGALHFHRVSTIGKMDSLQRISVR
jgi:Cd2+/Zn2+-exporting ATPase